MTHTTETPALPTKKYSIIYADPPWYYTNKASRGAATNHYATMKDKDVQALPVKDLAAEDCVLILWATFPKLRDALDLIDAWGFTYKTVAFNWVKQNKSGEGLFMGLGNWTRSNSEICLLATKGKPKRSSAGVHSVVLTPVQRHSQKPDEVRDRIVELLGDLPRIELFARSAAEGWDCWGNEAPNQQEEDDDEWMK